MRYNIEAKEAELLIQHFQNAKERTLGKIPKAVARLQYYNTVLLPEQSVAYFPYGRRGVLRVRKEDEEGYVRFDLYEPLAKRHARWESEQELEFEKVVNLLQSYQERMENRSFQCAVLRGEFRAESSLVGGHRQVRSFLRPNFLFYAQNYHRKFRRREQIVWRFIHNYHNLSMHRSFLFESVEQQFLKEVKKFLVSFNGQEQEWNCFFFRQYFRKVSVSTLQRVRGIGNCLVELYYLELNALHSRLRADYFLLSVHDRASKYRQYKLILEKSDVEVVLGGGRELRAEELRDRERLQAICRAICEKVRCEKKLVYSGLVVPLESISARSQMKSYVLYNNFQQINPQSSSEVKHLRKNSFLTP